MITSSGDGIGEKIGRAYLNQGKSYTDMFHFINIRAYYIKDAAETSSLTITMNLLRAPRLA